MNYIELLTREEKTILCEIITGKDFKEHFKSNEQKFLKMRKGFRNAKSLSEKNALLFAKTNVDNPFIAQYVDLKVNIWLKEIQENIEKLEGEGSTHDTALATAILDSFFANNVDLYFKLAGKTLDMDAFTKLHDRMESIKSERMRNAEFASHIKIMEEEKQHLFNQIEAAQQSVDTIKTEYEQKVQEIEQKKDQLQSLFAEAQQKFDLFEAKLGSAATSLTEAQETLQKKQLEEKRLNEIIAEKEKLAEDVEKAINEKIQKAQENMAFISKPPVHMAETEASATVEVLSKPIITPYHTFSAFGNPNDLEANHSWTDVISTSAFELIEAGVAEKHIIGLSAFLCAAYIEKQPILLVGPNAIDIAQAFSAAIAGHKYGMLYCEGNYSNQTIAEIGADGEDIVIIINLLSSGWMNRLPEILSRNDIFYIATHPYTEDIQVEPKSLYGFMLPLFSEFFVDKKATGKYYGGYFADDFKPYSTSKSLHNELRILSKFALSPLVRSRIGSLVATMHDIHSATTADEEFLFAIFPIAYASLAISELTEAVNDPKKGITISANLKRDLQYILGEI